MNPAVVSAVTRAALDGPFRLALSRGALFGETLDALDRAGVPTAELRGDSSSLVFEAGEIVLVTMRPSVVPDSAT